MVRRRSDLAAKSLLTLSGMSRLVDRLERAELVERSTPSEDRRGAYARLTAAGMERFQAPRMTDTAVVRQHFLSLFDEQELATMTSFWRRFHDHEHALHAGSRQPARGNGWANEAVPAGER